MRPHRQNRNLVKARLVAVLSSATEVMMTTDSQLQKSVLAELVWEPIVDAGHIGVTAHNGVVTLTGMSAAIPRNWQLNAPYGR